MIVVADTSPLNYLVLIDEIDLLPALFGTVLLPQAVFDEIQHPRASAKVRQWIANAPSWLEVRKLKSLPASTLLGLDQGEQEAIQLALELGIETVLIDEAAGRQQAEKLHLEVRGTLGILERGARIGKADLRQALTKLRATNFRAASTLYEALLSRNPQP